MTSIIQVIGKSVQGRDIKVTIFDTPTTTFKLLIQCRQHGNEEVSQAAGEKLFQDITNNPSFYSGIKIGLCTVANPDGANANDREQSQGVDMNRDRTILEAPESILMAKFIQLFKPDVFVDMHTFGSSQPFLDDINRQYANDVSLDKNNNPDCRIQLSDATIKSMIASFETDNPGYDYDWYLRDDRHSTIDITDARNFTAFRYDCLSFLLEGREPRSDENKTAVKTRVTQAQFLLIKSLIKYLKNNTASFLKTLNPIPVGADVGARFGYQSEEPFTLNLYCKTSKQVAPYTFKAVDVNPQITTSIKNPLAYAIPLVNTKVLDWMTKQGFIGVQGTTIDKYDIETLKFGSSTSSKPSTIKSTKTGFTTYKIYNTQNSEGHALPQLLEPYASYSIKRYKSELSLSVKSNSNYPILRLIRKLA